MHELSVTQHVLDIAVKKAGEAGASSIKRINLVIGDMSSFMDDSVQLCFDLLSENSIAKGANLSFKRVPLTMRCRHCNHSFTPSGERWSCPQCKEWDVEVITGNEFYLESIEVEK
jgi:hydrogenase nickel incorporation protein HypA/HybF